MLGVVTPRLNCRRADKVITTTYKVHKRSMQQCMSRYKMMSWAIWEALIIQSVEKMRVEMKEDNKH